MDPLPGSDVAAPAVRGKVLYIEDLATSYLIVQNVLARLPGVELIHAATGRDGIAKARSEQPDHVLLDMHLPDLSGVDVVRELSRDIAERRLPVTIITADALTMDVLKAMSLGAFEYLVKPVDAHKLEASVRRALTMARAGDPPHRG